MTEEDAQEVFAAGWDERALHDAVSVCGVFNFLNRLVDGLGITGDRNRFIAAAERLSSPDGYVRSLDEP